ncbi:MAG: ATP-binding cassette domain-containing protein [Crocinitomicaceae bacterium]|nr:ATP-binding cassette domain-containing protein [Crocinitomicaceae bacterium]
MAQPGVSPLHRFWLLIKPDKKEIRNVYVYAVFYGLVQLSLPIGIQAIINLIQGGQISTSWVILVACVIGGIVVTGILQISQLQITEHLQQKIFARAAFEFAYRIPKIKLEELYKKYAPELMNRFFDIVSVQKGLSKILIDFSTASIQTIFGLLLLSMYHPFFIVFSLVLVALVYSIFKLTSKRGLETSLKESKSKYYVAAWLEELARASISFKLAGKTDLPLEKTNDEVEMYIGARDSHFKVLKQQYILMVIFKVIVAAGLLIVGSLLVMEQQMNIGQFVAAEIIILLIIGSVEKLILSLETMYDVITSLEKIGQVTDLELERETGMNIHEMALKDGLKVEVSNIDFHYPDQDKFVFKNASLTINDGEKILLLGDGSSGKTTFLYLLGGLYNVKSGSVSFNDLPLANFNPVHIRSLVGNCLSNETLFEGTIMENITMGRDGITFENIQWIVQKLKLTEYIKSLPKGYNTMVLAQGKSISRGKIDKLILARALVGNPKLVLIKDAFNTLREAERHEMFEFLTDKSHPWTLVVSTSDENLKQYVDRTVMAENGQLIELN